MSNELAVYKSQDGEEIKLTADNVREYFCKDATDKELAVFASQAKMFQANPWANEIYLVKYNGKPASTILSYHTFNRIASAQKDYNGIESGVIVHNKNTGKVEYNDGAAVFEQIGQQLIGGWAKVYRKGIEHPFSVSINLKDFDKGTANWKSMKAFMIEKVAKGQAWRLAYPSMFHNVYTDAEIISAQTPQNEPQDAEIVEYEPIPEGASIEAKQALWNVCKRVAELRGVTAEEIADKIKSRSDYEDTDDFILQVVSEYQAEIEERLHE